MEILSNPAADLDEHERLRPSIVGAVAGFCPLIRPSAKVEYISHHGVHAAALRFGCNPKSLYNWLCRQEHTHLSRDALSLREVCTHLRIRRSEATRWIEVGLLKAVQRESRTGVVSYLIEFDALQRFCKERRNLLVTRRSSALLRHISAQRIIISSPGAIWSHIFAHAIHNSAHRSQHFPRMGDIRIIERMAISHMSAQ